MRKRGGSSPIVSIAIIFILCLLLSYTPTCKAAIVWQDDFSDGDYDGWYADNDVLSASNHSLRLVSSSLILGHVIIHHNSTMANGTWSFDVYMGEDSAGTVSIRFIHMSTVPAGHTETIFGYFYSGYNLQIDQTGLLLGVYRQTDVTNIGIYRPLGGLTGWHNINITRNLDGLFVVYCNGTRAFDAVDKQITASKYFVTQYDGYMDSEGSHFALDNVIVSDTVDITPPASLAGYGAIMLGVVIAVAVLVIWFRRE